MKCSTNVVVHDRSIGRERQPNPERRTKHDCECADTYPAQSAYNLFLHWNASEHTSSWGGAIEPHTTSVNKRESNSTILRGVLPGAWAPEA